MSILLPTFFCTSLVSFLLSKFLEVGKEYVYVGVFWYVYPNYLQEMLQHFILLTIVCLRFLFPPLPVLAGSCHSFKFLGFFDYLIDKTYQLIALLFIYLIIGEIKLFHMFNSSSCLGPFFSECLLFNLFVRASYILRRSVLLHSYI